MAIAELFTDSGTSISTTEYSLPNDANYAAGSAIATDAIIQVIIGVSAMVAGDQYEFKVYDKVYSGAGSQEVIYYAVLTGPQTGPLVIPSLIVLHAWDVTAKRLAGSDRSLNWSIRAVT